MRRLKLRLEGAELSVGDVDGVGQTLDGNVDRADRIRGR